jgi:aminopeptidase N
MHKKIYTISILFLIILILPVSSQQFSSKTLELKTTRYELDVKVDYKAEKVNGKCRLTVLNPTDKPISHIPLILYRLLKVTAITDEQGAAIPYQQNVLSFEDWEQLQVNYVEVRLPRPLESNQCKTITIQYEGFLFGYAKDGWRYVKDHIAKEFTFMRWDGFGYPVVGYPSDKVNRRSGLQSYDYTLSVTVPEDLIVANGGKLTDKSTVNGQTTYTYTNLKPAWRLDMPIAPYGILEDKLNNLKIFHFLQDKDNAGMILEAMKKSLQLYTNWFGPADKFQGFAIIEIPEGYGSQTDVTSILQTADAFQKHDNLTALYHEIAHIWSVRDNDPLPDRFESEGLAMFLQYLVQERLDNKPDALKNGYKRLSDSFRKQCERNPEYKDVPIIQYGNEDMTDLSYTKGMLFFYILYHVMGEKDFLDATGSFYQKYKKTGATSEEFLNHVKERSLQNLERLYQEWIYGVESSKLILDGIPVEELVSRYKK